MHSIAKIEELIESAELILIRHEKELSRSPNSLFSRAMVKTTRDRINELRGNLYFEKSVREKEIIDLRLKGKLARVGKLPLELLGAFAKILAETITEIGRQNQFGNTSSSKNYNETKNTIDLMFERLIPGSTHIIVTGKTNPDLFGNSIIENALENTFELLNTNDANQLLESSAKIGGKGVKKLNQLLKMSVESELEFDLEWKSPNSTFFSWHGDKIKMQSITNSISKIQSNEPVEFEISGTIFSMSMKGIIEVHDKDKKLYKINFPLNLLEKVRNYQIGDNCNIICIQKGQINSLTREEKVSFELKELA